VHVTGQTRAAVGDYLDSRADRSPLHRLPTREQVGSERTVSPLRARAMCVVSSHTGSGYRPTRRCSDGSGFSGPRHQPRRGRGLERRQCQKRNRVRPPGSVAETTIAERGSTRYTFHGGGPCDGALNGAVMPDPLSSGSAGQPLSAHAFAMRATALGSVTRAASPSITTSASRIDTATEHRGSRATLRPLRVPAPVWNQNVPSTHRAPTAVTCGLPSSLTVDSHVVREFSASGAGADLASSFSTTAAQSPAATHPPDPD
jgi:hypothetical protein